MESTYADAVKEHARIAVQLYQTRVPELAQLSGLHVSADGSNTAGTAEDVRQYLDAIKTIGGPVAYISARLLLTNAINKRGLSPVALYKY